MTYPPTDPIQAYQAPEGWPPPQPGYQMPPPPQPRRRRPVLRAILAGVGVLAALGIISAVLGSGAKPARHHAAATPSPAASSQAAAAAHPVVLARFHGTGDQSTPKFRIRGSGDWTLRWSYNCKAFGDKGNFIVDEDKGGADFNGASVNELGRHGHGATHVYSDAGSHFLEVSSECAWTLRVVGQR